MQALVEAGLGLSLIPEMACRKGAEGSPVYRRLDDPRPVRSIVAVWPRHRPPSRATREFLRFLHPAATRTTRLS
jgi:DNA-binding transcriptional LysR family regulator